MANANNIIFLERENSSHPLMEEEDLPLPEKEDLLPLAQDQIIILLEEGPLLQGEEDLNLLHTYDLVPVEGDSIILEDEDILVQEDREGLLPKKSIVFFQKKQTFKF